MHAHAHGHAHSHATGTRAITVGLVLTSVFLLVEAAVGWRSGSLALLADAGHMLGDAGALGLALLAARFARRQAGGQATFGYRRAEVLAAFLNGVALAAISVWILASAVWRLLEPVVLRTGGLLETASLGLLVNLIVAFVLSRASSGSVNVRAALAHVLLDVLGSLGAILSASAARFLGWHGVDPLVSLLVGGLVCFGGYRIVRETTLVLLESAPGEISTGELARTIAATPGVGSFHDLHAWRISDGFDAVTVHVVLASGYHGVEVSREVARRIDREHGLTHVTVQPEAPPPRSVVPLGRKRPRVP